MTERLLRSPVLLAGAFVLCALLGAALYAGIQALLPAAAGGTDRGRVETIVRDYMLEHPEIIPEAMERLRDRETAKVIDANRAAIVDPFGSAWEGNPDGDVTVVAYMDYACGFCRASLPVLDRLVAENPQVRIVYRELPILSEASRRAAEWSLAAAEQGRFLAYHDALYVAGRLTDATIDAAIEAAGLDRERGEAVANSEAVASEIASNLSIAGQLGVTGTPAWVIGDRMLSGALPYEAMEAAVEAAGERK